MSTAHVNGMSHQHMLAAYVKRIWHAHGMNEDHWVTATLLAKAALTAKYVLPMLSVDAAESLKPELNV